MGAIYRIRAQQSTLYSALGWPTSLVWLTPQVKSVGETGGVNLMSEQGSQTSLVYSQTKDVRGAASSVQHFGGKLILCHWCTLVYAKQNSLISPQALDPIPRQALDPRHWIDIGLQ